MAQKTRRMPVEGNKRTTVAVQTSPEASKVMDSLRQLLASIPDVPEAPKPAKKRWFWQK